MFVPMTRSAVNDPPSVLIYHYLGLLSIPLFLVAVVPTLFFTCSIDCSLTLFLTI